MRIRKNTTGTEGNSISITEMYINGKTVMAHPRIQKVTVMKTIFGKPINFIGHFMSFYGVILTAVSAVAVTLLLQGQGNPVKTASNIRDNPITSVLSLHPPIDDQAAKNYVSSVVKIVSRFESAYQSARVSNLNINTGADYLMEMNVSYEKFKGLKYSPDNPMVLELRRLAGSWMENRMIYIGKLIMENADTNDYSSLVTLKEGNAIYITLLEQLNRTKSHYSIVREWN